MRQSNISKFMFVMCIVSISTAVQAAKPALPKKLTEQEKLIVELTGKEIKKLSDVEVYGALIDADYANNDIAFKSRLQTLLTDFKNSSFADNALYLAAKRAMLQKDFAGALRHISRIEKDYPRSNKLVSAQLLKALCYKNIGLSEQAQKAFVELRMRFPGSPESFRAGTELQLLSKMN